MFIQLKLFNCSIKNNYFININVYISVYSVTKEIMKSRIYIFNNEWFLRQDEYDRRRSCRVVVRPRK